MDNKKIDKLLESTLGSFKEMDTETIVAYHFEVGKHVSSILEKSIDEKREALLKEESIFETFIK